MEKSERSKEEIIQFVIFAFILLGCVGGVVYHIIKKKKTFNQSASILAFGKKLKKIVKV